MMKRLVYLRVDEEPVRGPLDARAVIQSVHAGVLSKDAVVSASKDGTFIPVAELETQLTDARRRVTRSALGIALALMLLGGALAGGIHYYRGRPEKLCDATPRLLASLPSELAIDAYVTRGTPKLDAFANKLETLLYQYEAASPNKVKVRVIEANDQASQTAAKEAGLQQMDLAEGQENSDAVSVRRGYSGVVLRYGGAHDVIKYLPPNVSDGLEFWITSKIRELHAREDHAGYRLAVATGHGETSLRAANLVPRAAGSTPNVQAVIEQNFPFYAFVETDLTKAAPDAHTAGLLITQPSADLSDAELSRIDEYVMQGHSLVVAASAVNVHAGDPTMTFTLSAHGLPKLLASYGIHMHEDLVLDLHHSFAVKVASAGGMSTQQMSFMPLVYSGDSKADASFLDKDAAIFFNMPTLPFPFASSLTLEETKQPEATFHVLAKTSKESALVTKGRALWPSAPPGEGAHAPAVVAASVEGVLTSGFGHGKSPKSTRVLVLSSGAMFGNPLASASNAPRENTDPMMPATPPTDEMLSQLSITYAQQDLTQVILALKNSLDWMASDEDLARCAGRLIKKSD